MLREHMGEQEQDKKGKGELEKKGRGRKKQTKAKEKEQSKTVLKRKRRKHNWDKRRHYKERTGIDREKIIEKIISLLERIKPNKPASAFHFSFIVCVRLVLTNVGRGIFCTSPLCHPSVHFVSRYCIFVSAPAFCLILSPASSSPFSLLCLSQAMNEM